MATSVTDRKPLPESIPVVLEQAQRITPNQMRMLRAATGKTIEEVFGDKAAEEDRLQAIIWLELRRQGYDPTWDEAGDVAMDMAEEPGPDPTSNGSSTGSPPSAASGA